MHRNIWIFWKSTGSSLKIVFFSRVFNILRSLPRWWLRSLAQMSCSADGLQWIEKNTILNKHPVFRECITCTFLQSLATPQDIATKTITEITPKHGDHFISGQVPTNQKWFRNAKGVAWFCLSPLAIRLLKFWLLVLFKRVLFILLHVLLWGAPSPFWRAGSNQARKHSKIDKCIDVETREKEWYHYALGILLWEPSSKPPLCLHGLNFGDTFTFIQNKSHTVP